MRLLDQKVHRVAGYFTDIRRYLESHNGRPKRSYREAYDSQFDEAGTQQFTSLWGVQAQVAIREAQARRVAVRERQRSNSGEVASASDGG
jgi:hypothetical protein